ncbi:MAG: phenylalanine--tRNA ligase subunit alpha [Alphaproteobacteria bacterium]|nr:phenylalanine--tRNA ligase subunit alpha [Alphaproteobacteria bacterium]
MYIDAEIIKDEGVCMTEILKKVQGIKDEFKHRIGQVSDLRQLDELRVAYVGKKGQVKVLMGGLRDIVDPEVKKAAAAEFNSLMQYVESNLDESHRRIEAIEYTRQVEVEAVDMTMPGRTHEIGARHPLSDIETECMEVLRTLGFEYVDGPEIETPEHNFDVLNIPEHHPARDMQDTFWLENNLLLRSHTTTVQARVLESRRDFPIKIVSPGKVYRNEAVDATHLACFHQFEGLCVDKGIRFTDLKGTIDHVIRSIFGSNWQVRFKPKFYPYTEPSVGMDISEKVIGGEPKWITIGGAGMVHPQVFRNLGHDPDQVSGFAFGLGISRMVAMRQGLDHIKTLYEGDLRVHRAVAHKQFDVK